MVSFVCFGPAFNAFHDAGLLQYRRQRIMFEYKQQVILNSQNS